MARSKRGGLSNQIKSNGIKIKCLIRYHLEIQSSPMEKMLDELIDSLPAESNSIITVDVGGVVARGRGDRRTEPIEFDLGGAAIGVVHDNDALNLELVDRFDE